MTESQQVQSCTKNYMIIKTPLDRENCLMGGNSIVNIGDYMAYNMFKTSKIYNLT